MFPFVLFAVAAFLVVRFILFRNRCWGGRNSRSCRRCGRTADPYANYCPRCGQKL
jgi:predicted amidophosphoribosyltransferase